MNHKSIPAKVLRKDKRYWQVLTDRGLWYLLPKQFIDRDGMREGAEGYLTYKVSPNSGVHYFTNQPIEESN